MAIPSAGSALSLSDIQTEFGGSNPIALSEYYAGGDNVPSGTSGDAGSIPSSGTIAVSQFYGSSNRVAIALTISSTTQSYNIYSNRGGTYSAGNSDVTLTVQAIVGSQWDESDLDIYCTSESAPFVRSWLLGKEVNQIFGGYSEVSKFFN